MRRTENVVDRGQALSGLAEELKHLLTFIARQSEYLSSKTNDESLASVEHTAGNALKLIDHYLLYAQSEYGQQALPLETFGIGSILYDVSQELSASQQSQPIIDNAYSEPVLCNKKALVTSLVCLARIVIASASDKGNLHLVSARRHKGDIFAGVFARRFSLKNTELARAKEMVGKSNMALANQMDKNGVDLIIADGLAKSMGTTLEIYKYRGMNGLGVQLSKSQQLSLV